MAETRVEQPAAFVAPDDVHPRLLRDVHWMSCPSCRVHGPGVMETTDQFGLIRCLVCGIVTPPRGGWEIDHVWATEDCSTIVQTIGNWPRPLAPSSALPMLFQMASRYRLDRLTSTLLWEGPRAGMTKMWSGSVTWFWPWTIITSDRSMIRRIEDMYRTNQREFAPKFECVAARLEQTREHMLAPHYGDPKRNP